MISKLAILLLLLGCTYSQVLPQYTAQSLFPQYLASLGGTCCSDQTISVYGSATIDAAPDSAVISATVSVNGDTVDKAIAALARVVNSVISVLTANGLTDKNYETSSFSVYPNSSWANGVSTVLGQIATQSFQITVPSVDPKGTNIGKLIDDLATVNGIILNGLSFQVQDQTQELADARAKAFANAKNKAMDYATALQLSLGQIVSVTDSYSNAPVTTPVNDLPMLSLGQAAPSKVPTTINVGTVSISYNMQAVYSFSSC